MPFVIVLCLHVVCQTVRCVIRDLDRFGFGFEGDDGQDGAEYLFLCDGHIIGDVCKARRLAVVSAIQAVRPPQAARHKPRL